MRTSIVFTAMLLTGCWSLNPAMWSRPNTTVAQRNMDHRQCEYEGEKAAAGNSNPIMAGSASGTLYRMCMESKGYVK